MRRATTILLLVLTAAVLRAAPQSGSTAPNRGAAADWDRAAAAAYLDDRMDMWFANATKLRTGEEKTSCVSCHSSVPYALARPALRRALHAAAPTAQEARLADETTRRVESYEHARAPLRDQRRQEGRVAWDRGRAEPRRSGERRRGCRPARARQRHAEGARAPVGNAAARWRVGLAQLQARAVRNCRRRLPRRDARGARRRHGPRRRDVRRRREASRLPPRPLRRAESLQPYVCAARLGGADRRSDSRPAGRAGRGIRAAPAGRRRLVARSHGTVAVERRASRPSNRRARWTRRCSRNRMDSAPDSSSTRCCETASPRDSSRRRRRRSGG